MTAVHEHTSAPIPELSSPLTSQEQEWVDQFMDETTLFLGPDREIMRSHHITSRSEFEDECIAQGRRPAAGRPHPQAPRRCPRRGLRDV